MPEQETSDTQKPKTERNLFLAYSVGTVLGCIVTGVLCQKKFNKLLPGPNDLVITEADIYKLGLDDTNVLWFPRVAEGFNVRVTAVPA